MFEPNDTASTSTIASAASASCAAPKADVVYADNLPGASLVAYLASALPPASCIDAVAIDVCLAQIDRALCAQLNAILHHPTVQALEAAWRDLQQLVDHVDFSQNIQVECLHVTRDELAADFDDSPELVRSGLYHLVYNQAYGVYGGEPYGVIVGNYAFGPNSQDVTLLGQIAAISAMAHAPFVTNACPKFFGSDDISELTRLSDVPSMLEGPHMTRYNAFRDSEHSRYVALCLPRVLLRAPYTKADKCMQTFQFEETVCEGAQNFLWGFASTALASRLADSFARYRWCPHIVGPQSGGAVDGLVSLSFSHMKTLAQRMPTEVFIGERLEHILSTCGFVPLCYRQAQAQACFLSASSAQKMRATDSSTDKQKTQAHLSTQLPYLFILTRLAHYIKVIQREAIGLYQGRTQLQHSLNVWLRQYTSDMEDPAPNVRAKRPLRRASVTVEDVLGQPDWFRCKIEVQPHLKYMGATTTLSLIGRLDRA